MEKIILFDTTTSGHHFVYNTAIVNGLQKRKIPVLFISKFTEKDKKRLKASGTAYYNVSSNIQNRFFLDLILLLKLIIISVKKGYKRIHLLYLDSILFQLLILFPIFVVFKIHVTGTLHWLPRRRIKREVFNSLLKLNFIKKVVVHGEYTKQEILRNYQIIESRVLSIPYPNLHMNYDVNMDLMPNIFPNHKYDRPYLLLFGGLRYDKGLDILLEALHLIRDEKFTVIIAGKEDYFTKDSILKLVKDYNLSDKVYLQLGYIPDEHVGFYFLLSDIVVLPYRKIFGGQSGPLTEGVVKSKVIIGPNIGEIGYTINKYNLGYTFIPEDVKNLADTIKKCLKEFHIKKKEFNKSLVEYQKIITVENFVGNYISFLKNKL
ncbi:glycosyltransferase family 4 protein [Anoxybacillus eryuanensis]|uniref:glycosyltransferase family 4 protein n=1 Tax=Anoxybacillus eryuanensis TaxID=651866 RepID=UPI003EF2186F